MRIGQVDSPEPPEITENLTKVNLTKLKETLINFV